ncbi:MAG: CpaF family protein [Caldilinea sp.]|nr:CpaF family protein [Caldilinea sp.]MDW8442112.1 CpaF family protein [Caldilineaceae bacterium]
MFNLKPPTDVDGRARPGRLPGERPGANAAYAQLRDRIQQRLLTELSPTATRTDNAEVRQALERYFNETLAELGLPMSRLERADIFDQLVADILGLGPLEALLADDAVTEILVNGPSKVYVERGGKLELTHVKFRDNEDVMRVIERIVTPLGRRVDESSPMVDARLPDGSRVNVIIPPLSLIGPAISIRKFPKHALTPDELIKKGAMTPGIADFLRACVKAALNIVVSGGTGTGKTTILNALSSFIPEDERIITIEDAAELRLQQPHVVRLESRPPNVEGKGAVTIRQLVINALRMRPDRIVVGEVRGGEALDMLQAMNTGHEGSMTTVHSNSARDTLRRVETMVLMAGMDLPLRAIREQIASAFDLIVHLGRLSDGSRKIVQIAEVQGMEGDTIVMQDIFQFVQTTVENGKVQGYFTPTGVRPKFYARLEAAGLFIQPSTFMPTEPGRMRR